MTSLPYVLVVLVAFGDSSVFAMRTAQGFASPLTCSMQAFLENEAAHDRTPDRTYVCVTRDRAAALAGESVGLAAARP